MDVDALRNSSRAIEVVNGDRYHVLNETQPVVSQAGQYLIRLTIERAGASDAGQYVCLGANNGGFTVRPAYLSVRPLRECRQQAPLQLHSVAEPHIIF